MRAATGPQPSPARRGASGRRLIDYPEPAARRLHLLLVVAITVALYYALYVGGAVATLIMREYRMSFTTFVLVLAGSNLVGAFASLLAGWSDRIGRAPLVVWGLLLVGVLTMFAIPLSTDRITWGVATVAIGFVEGIILVATPALMRDFSPQVGRATAMGFWAMGPVLGSLLVSAVASATMSETTPWRSQFFICGAVVLGIFVLALLFLRELRPEIRDQIMVSERDRKLLEWRASRIDVEAATASPWKQMMHFDIIASAIGVSLLLLFYYTAVAFGTVYTVTTFGFTIPQANAIANWGWATNAISLVFFGGLSDRLRVRKPFMLVGGLGALGMVVLYAAEAGEPASIATLSVLVSIQAVFSGAAYSCWMASFTETVEARNPALTATGLAIWGWILRIVVTLSFLLLPVVVTTVTDLVQAQTWIDAATAADKAGVAPSAEVLAHLARLKLAVAAEPGQWRIWWSICCAGVVVFLVLIFAMKGRWSPAAARRDELEHDRQVEIEVARMTAEAR